MQDVSPNNKRLAKNTLFLYVRMMFLMLISLYTSRVVLNALGVEDFGIYSVVGGLVSLLTVISATLNASNTRFLSYELGNNRRQNMRAVFTTAMNIQFMMSFVIIFLAETIGLWYLNHKLVIPDNRMVAANWCYQFSLLSFIVNLINSPYNASIIAHERMAAFAYISIAEAAGKLTVAWGISLCSQDRLIFYSIVMALVAIAVRAVYYIYCKHHFEECKYQFNVDLGLLKKMANFISWAFYGVSVWTMKYYGFRILLNLFYGPIINAAHAIATQVDVAVNGFVNNFIQALNPQITKSYASGNLEDMHSLIFRGARFSFYIMLILVLPILLNTSIIVNIWLETVPNHTILFIQLILLLSLLNCLGTTLTSAHIATGRIKKYQLVVSTVDFLNIPIAYISLYYGAIPESVVIVSLIIFHFTLAAQLIVLSDMIGLKIRQYLKQVYFNAIFVAVTASIIPILAVIISPNTIVSLILVTFISLSCTFLSVLYIGCNSKERAFFFNQYRKIKQNFLWQ